jgi:hypothetical protein
LQGVRESQIRGNAPGFQGKKCNGRCKEAPRAPQGNRSKGPEGQAALVHSVCSVYASHCHVLVVRRAQFLNKLAAPPSPSATDLPATPPDSPAIFHFTLPSPGLESPLELFENLLDHPELCENTARVEQVDFRLLHQKLEDGDHHHHSAAFTNNCASLLPSLDQISQRLNKVPTSVGTYPSPPPEQGSKGNCRLPPFLRSRTPSPTPEVTRPFDDQTPKRSRPVPARLALRNMTRPAHVVIRTPTPIAAFPQFPLSPTSPRRINLQVRTAVYPPSRTRSSPTEFTEVNIAQFGSEQSGIVSKPTVSIATTGVDQHIPARRAQVTKDMFNKLSRRKPGLLNTAACGIRAQDDISLLRAEEIEDRTRRRISAPAEMTTAQRGPRHPVLAKPGGF